MDLKKKIFVPELYIYDLLKFESPEVLMKSEGVNFINIKCAHFLYERLFSSYVLALNKLLYKKFPRLTLMKLTEGLTVSAESLVR